LRKVSEETNGNLKQNGWCAVRDASWTPHERQSTASLLHERNVDCLRHCQRGDADAGKDADYEGKVIHPV